jgi:hypothetical protein
MENRNQAADLLEQNIHEIMQRWETRALAEVSATFGESSLTLMDSLPQLLHTISKSLSTQVLSPEQVAFDAADALKFSKSHGRSRSGIPAYLINQVITEYQILRQCIFASLEEKIQISKTEQDIIIGALENAVSYAATEFMLVNQEIQDQFLLSVAHDLKTPITSIQAGVQLLHRSSDPSVRLTLTDRLEKQTKQMTDLVNLILDTNQLRTGEKLQLQMSECDLNLITKDILEDLITIHGDHFRLISPGPIIGLWDPNFLRRMLQSLLTNSIQHGLLNSAIGVTLHQFKDHTKIEIHNWGNPISIFEQNQILSTYQRLKGGEEKKGWGLGLTLARGIIDALQGSMDIKSSLEFGTSFIITLPNQPEKSEAIRLAG